jgi:hypothetical protein
MSAKIYRGSWTLTSPVLTIDNNGWVYEGTPILGTPIMKISGDSVYKGSTSWGFPLATVKGKYIYKGTGFGTAPIATISGDSVFEGSGTFGAPLATISGGGKMSAAAAAVYLLLM